MKEIFRLDFTEYNDLLIVVFLIFGILTFASLLFFIVGKIRPNANLVELKARTKSWWFMALVFIGATIINTNISYFAIGLLSFIAFRELYSVLYRLLNAQISFTTYLQFYYSMVFETYRWC